MQTTLERLAAALKRVGFDAVFDTGFAADLTMMEEASELLDRVQNGGVAAHVHQLLPGLGRYVETHRPDLIPHLSTCKSPQQMAGGADPRGATRVRRHAAAGAWWSSRSCRARPRSPRRRT